MKTKEIVLVALSSVALICSIMLFAMTILTTMNFTGLAKDLFSAFFVIFAFTAISSMLRGYVRATIPEIIAILRPAIFEIISRVRLIRINSLIHRSFRKSLSDEPMLAAYESFIPIKLKLSRKVKGISIEYEHEKAIAAVPLIDMDVIAKVVHEYIQSLSETLIIRGKDKRMQRAIDLAVTALVLEKAGENNEGLRIAMNMILQKYFEDKEVKNWYRLLRDLNDRLKEKKLVDKITFRRILFRELSELFGSK